MAQNYLVASWQGLVQMLVNLCGKGYYYYHLTDLPISKQHKWGDIDVKMIDKYKTNKSKWQRQRQKANGIANFYYLRWEHIMFVLHTSGKEHEEIQKDDKFSDIRQKPILLQITDLTTFRIQFLEGKIDVTLDRETYVGLKTTLYNVVKTKNIGKIKYEFNKTNGFPAYSGIFKQKKQLAEYVVEQSKKHAVKIQRKDKKGNRNLTIKDLRLNSRKRTVKNFEDPYEELSNENSS